MTESMARTSDETELNMLIATVGTLIRSFKFSRNFEHPVDSPIWVYIFFISKVE